MKYMLLIHHGTTPVPGNDAWDALSNDEKGAIYATACPPTPPAG